MCQFVNAIHDSSIVSFFRRFLLFSFSFLRIYHRMTNTDFRINDFVCVDIDMLQQAVQLCCA